jgi:hypothetical protein
MEKSAVSADEKKPDRMISSNSIKTWFVMMVVSLPCPHGDGWIKSTRIKRTIDDMFEGLAGIRMGLASFVTSS